MGACRSRTNADDRLPADPLGRIESGDGIVEGREAWNSDPFRCAASSVNQLSHHRMPQHALGFKLSTFLLLAAAGSKLRANLSRPSRSDQNSAQGMPLESRLGVEQDELALDHGSWS
jgi:hypothetical protein